MTNRKALLVLGMHRSGTSAITRVLNMLGAALPRRLMPAAVANPVGHFEPMDIVAIHDRILNSAGTKWSDWSRFPASWYDSPHRELFVDEIVQAVRDNYGDADLFVVKDPRMARLVPIWREALARLEIEPVAVVPYRNPIEVAQSLSTRDRFTLGQGFLIWLRHCLDAEVDTRGMPRCFVSYDRLIAEGQMTAFKIMEALPIAWPRKTAQALSDISAFLDPKLYRQKVPLVGLQHPDVPEAVGVTFSSLVSLAEDEADLDVRARLDAVRTDLDVAATLTFAAFENLTAEQQRLDRHVIELGNRVDQLIGDFADAVSDVRRAKDASLEESEVARSLAVDALRSEIERLGEKSAGVDLLRSEIGRLDAGLAAVDVARSDELDALRDDLVAEAASLRAGQAFADAELGAVDERLRRLTGSYALDAHDARKTRRKPRSRFRLSQPRKDPTDDERERLRRLVLGSGLFDADWYRDQHGDAVATAEDALDHFVSVGLTQNFDPGPSFAASWYLETNPDVREAGLVPLVHYVQSGITEGRRGRPRPAPILPETSEPDHEP